MERQFDSQIEKLRNKVLKVCSLVDEQVDLAIRAIKEDNDELAQLVIERDNKVDKFDVKIQKACQKIIALNQPVAMDLRLIISALTIDNNIERIGDIAVNIAERNSLIKSRRELLSSSKFHEMSSLVKEMLRYAIDSFIQNDPKLARKVIETDKFLDNYNRENHDILIKLMKEDASNIEPAVALIEISRQLERIGDHATNIAEDVFFIVEAEMIKHKYEKYIFSEEEEDIEDDLLS